MQKHTYTYTTHTIHSVYQLSPKYACNTHTNTHTHTHKYTHKNIETQFINQTHIHTTHTCMHTCMHACTHTYMHTHMHACMQTTHTDTHRHSLSHTHTHTHIHKSAPIQTLKKKKSIKKALTRTCWINSIQTWYRSVYRPMKLHAFDAAQHWADVVLEDAALSGWCGRPPQVLGHHKLLGQGSQFSLPEGVLHQACPAKPGGIKGSALNSQLSLFPHKLFSPDRYVGLCPLAECRMVWVWFSTQIIVCLPRWIAVDISWHQSLCAITSFEGFLQSQPVLHSIALV